MATSPGSATRVLVVDDEPVVRDVLTRYLRREGFEVTGAADGHEALTAIRHEQPDVILLDLMLPKVDGLSVLAQLRKERTTPVIWLVRVPLMPGTWLSTISCSRSTDG